MSINRTRNLGGPRTEAWRVFGRRGICGHEHQTSNLFACGTWRARAGPASPRDQTRWPGARRRAAPRSILRRPPARAATAPSCGGDRPAPTRTSSLVTRLDCLARSTRDVLNVVDTVKQAGAGFRSLKDTWADNTTPPHRQRVLTILGGFAEFERMLIRARAGEGRERAKARGVRFAQEALGAPAWGGTRPDQRGGSRRRGGAHVRRRPRNGVSSTPLAGARFRH
jgi:hypothetical protein